MTDHDATGPGADTPVDVQGEIRKLRTGLFTGRGPGASPVEVDRYTRERRLYAGRPVAEQLERLHERTAVARGDAEAIEHHLDQTLNRLVSDVDHLTARVDPRRRWAATRLILIAASGLPGIIGLACLAGLVRGPETERKESSHRSRRWP